MAAHPADAGRVTLPQPETTGGDYFILSDALAALENGGAVAFPPFEIVHLAKYGLTFCLNMRRDPIQAAIRGGDFFELDELLAIKDHVKIGAQVIDIGSNIGNHALWFAHVMQAARVVVIEPNPLAMAPLMASVLINRLDTVIDLSALGIGLSDTSAGGYGMKRHDRNLGATKMRAGKGDMQVHRGDDLFDGETPDLIKIDVEGMEIKVLSGLKQVISTHRPVMLIEVDGENDAAFHAWMKTNRYTVQRTDRHSRKNCNYLITPEAT